jgi:hypothetical protein
LYDIFTAVIFKFYGILGCYTGQCSSETSIFVTKLHSVQKQSITLTAKLLLALASTAILDAGPTGLIAIFFTFWLLWEASQSTTRVE